MEVERFYQRFGLLVALTYVLHTGDLHFENIIAVNEYPVLLDCETLLCNSNQILRQDSALEKNQGAVIRFCAFFQDFFLDIHMEIVQNMMWT